VCTESGDELQQQAVTVSFIDFDGDDGDYASLTTDSTRPRQQCYFSALLLNLAADTTLDEVHTLHQGLVSVSALKLIVVFVITVMYLMKEIAKGHFLQSPDNNLAREPKNGDNYR